MWLWFATTFVVTDSDSEAVAIRMPVRIAVRRADAWFDAAECVDCAAFCAVSRWPFSHSVELPFDDEWLAAPLAIRMLPLAASDVVSAWKVLPPLTISLNAELKVACVEVSASALCA